MARQRAGCLFGWLANLFQAGGGPAEVAMPKVMVSKFFITPDEGLFFRILQEVIGDRAHVLAQVSLKQLLYLPGNHSTPARARWQNKINQKSIDFLICHAKTLRPILAIELDDATHSSDRRRSRDDEVKALLNAAALPLLQYSCRKTYDARDIAAAVERHLAKESP